MEALAEPIAAGVSPVALIECGLDAALRHPLRGSRWTDATLALATALSLSDRLGAAIGRPAAVSALHFLAGSTPAPPRSEVPLSPPTTAIGWFEAGTSRGVGGWGRHAMTARAGWALALRFPSRSGAVRTAFAAHWHPPEPDREHDRRMAAVESAHGSSPSPSPGFDGVALVREGRIREVLAGDASDAFVSAGIAGEEADALAGAVAAAAVRACAVLPGLRQLHGVLVGRAMLEAVSVTGLDVRAPLLAGARFVSEGWAAAQRSGRVPAALARRVEQPVVAATGVSLGSLAELGAPLDLTLSWGHPLRLVDAALALRDRLPDGGGGWLEAAVTASAETWPKSKRPWLEAEGGHV